MKLIRQPDDEIRAGDWIINQLKSKKFKRLSVAVAFVKASGVSRIKEALKDFVDNGGQVRFVVGIDHQGTSIEGLQSLINLFGINAEIWVIHNEDKRESPTFHPKIYLFENDEFAEVLIGSNNLTKGGLFTNYEVSVSLRLHQVNLEEKELWEKLQSAFTDWCRETDISKLLSEDVLARLLDEHKLGSERAEQAERGKSFSHTSSDNNEEEFGLGKTPLFGSVRIRSAPKPATYVNQLQDSKVVERKVFPSQSWFGITVLEGDLPQSGSSNEIRITKGIRNQNPHFWGWNDRFSYDETTGQFTRKIRIFFNDKLIDAYLKDFPAQKPDGTKASADFRLGSIAPIVKVLQNENDLVILELSNNLEFDFVAYVIPVIDSHYEGLADGLIPYHQARNRKTGTYKKFKYV